MSQMMQFAGHPPAQTGSDSESGKLLPVFAQTITAMKADPTNAADHLQEAQ